MTAGEFWALHEAGVLGKLELLAGRPVFTGRYEVAFSAEQVAAAAAAGVRLPSPVDVVLSDPELRAQVMSRLGGELQGPGAGE